MTAHLHFYRRDWRTRSWLFALLVPLLCIAQNQPGLRIEQAWARATPPGVGVGGAYLTIVNDGPADELVALSSPVSQSTEMHRTTMNGSMMEMRQVEKLPVPAHSRIRFEPGELHVMLVNLKQPLQEGQHFLLELRFAHAGRKTVEVVVRALGDPGPAEMSSH